MRCSKENFLQNARLFHKNSIFFKPCLVKDDIKSFYLFSLLYRIYFFIKKKRSAPENVTWCQSIFISRILIIHIPKYLVTTNILRKLCARLKYSLLENIYVMLKIYIIFFFLLKAEFIVFCIRIWRRQNAK